MVPNAALPRRSHATRQARHRACRRDSQTDTQGVDRTVRSLARWSGDPATANFHVTNCSRRHASQIAFLQVACIDRARLKVALPVGRAQGVAATNLEIQARCLGAGVDPDPSVGLGRASRAYPETAGARLHVTGSCHVRGHRCPMLDPESERDAAPPPRRPGSSRYLVPRGSTFSLWWATPAPGHLTCAFVVGREVTGSRVGLPP